MPTLNWIGKEKVVSHHQDVPYRVLEHKYTWNAENNDECKMMNDESIHNSSFINHHSKHSSLISHNSSGAIIHGDNLEALKSLLPEYEGKIKCIYIDPPYNTGNESWVYNDNVNHPKIKKWLGEVVGKDGEDLTRHDKWLCMMYPRLKLLHKLLADDGAIFISIDENEISNLKLMMDEIFGVGNFIEQLVWNKRVPKNDKFIGNIHEYVLLFVKNKSREHKFIQRKEGIPEINELLYQLKRKKTSIPKAEIEIKNLYKKNAYDRGITLYNSLDENYKLWGKINVSWPNGQTYGPRYDVLHPKTKQPCKVPDRGWRWTKETFDSMLDYDNVKELHNGSFICGKIWFAKDENTQPSSIKYLDEVSDFLLRSIISTKSVGGVSLKELTEKSFDYPKPVSLIETLLNSINTSEGIILDSFAGSGTTAHAVLNLNKQDGGNRKFILVEMEDYANDITAERVKRVAKRMLNDELGMMNEKDKEIHKSSFINHNYQFDFYELGLPLFDENQNLNEQVGLAKIREYIWYSETRSPFNDECLTMNDESIHHSSFITHHSERSTFITHNYKLGVKDGTVYYFIYEKDRLTTLDYDALELIKTKGEQYVIYADNCLLPKDFMAKKNIIFKKIPRDITRF